MINGVCFTVIFMSSDKKKLRKLIMTSSLISRVRELERENKSLRLELWKHQRKPSRVIGYLLLSMGAIALSSSFIFTSNILAFIGLGLTFWGTLLLFIRSVKYVKGQLLNSTVVSTLSAINKVILELNYKGRAIYLPPRQLKSLNEVTVYIPAKDEVNIPTIEEANKVFINNPRGLCLPSAGSGLMSLYEEELGTNFSKVELDYLQTNLPKLFIEDLEMFKDFEMNLKGDVIHVKIEGSIYQDLCNQVGELNHVRQSYGCPLCASIACVLTKATGKPMQIEKIIHSNNEVIEVWYRILEPEIHTIRKLLAKLRKSKKITLNK